MTSNKLKLIAFSLVLLVACVAVHPQMDGGGSAKKVRIQEGLGQTWKGPSSSLIERLLKKKASGGTVLTAGGRPKPVSPPPARAVPVNASVIFRPGKSPGVDTALATAFATNPTEKQALLQLFEQVRKGYETEVAKEGKSNNLAAAMTFFIASNVVAYHRTDLPSDEMTEDLFITLRDLMISAPEMSKLTNTEKQQMHDWLVYMGGFVLAGYLDAKENNDAESLDNYRSIANASTKIVLGVDVSQLTFSSSGLTVSGGSVALMQQSPSFELLTDFNVTTSFQIAPRF